MQFRILDDELHSFIIQMLYPPAATIPTPRHAQALIVPAEQALCKY